MARYLPPAEVRALTDAEITSIALMASITHKECAAIRAALTRARDAARSSEK